MAGRAREMTDPELVPLRAAAEVSQAALRGVPPRRLCSLIARQSRNLLRAALIAVYTPAEEGQGMALRCASGLGSRRVSGWAIRTDDPGVARVLETREPRMVPLQGGSWPNVLPAAVARQLGWGLLVPVVAQGRAVALLLAARHAGEAAFSQSDHLVGQLLAAQGTAALAHHSMRAAVVRIDLIEDRERIATDLQDGVVQRLFGLGLSLQAQLEQAKGSTVRRRLEAAINGIDHTVTELRAYIEELRPSADPGRQLHLALRKIAADTVDRSHLAIELDIDEDVAARLAGVREPLLRLARAALTDVLRYPAIRWCRLSLHHQGEHAVLQLADDGRGYYRESRLHRIQDHAAALDAGLEAEAIPEQGTTVRVRLKLG